MVTFSKESTRSNLDIYRGKCLDTLMKQDNGQKELVELGFDPISAVSVPSPVKQMPGHVWYDKPARRRIVKCLADLVFLGIANPVDVIKFESIGWISNENINTITRLFLVTPETKMVSEALASYKTILDDIVDSFINRVAHATKKARFDYRTLVAVLEEKPGKAEEVGQILERVESSLSSLSADYASTIATVRDSLQSAIDSELARTEKSKPRFFKKYFSWLLFWK